MSTQSVGTWNDPFLDENLLLFYPIQFSSVSYILMLAVGIYKSMSEFHLSTLATLNQQPITGFDPSKATCTLAKGRRSTPSVCYLFPFIFVALYHSRSIVSLSRGRIHGGPRCLECFCGAVFIDQGRVLLNNGSCSHPAKRTHQR